MNAKRWASLLLVVGLALALSPLAVTQAAPSATTTFTGQLTTTFAPDDRCDGNMIDITPQNEIVLTELDLHLDNAGEAVPVVVYYRVGSHAGVENDRSQWIELDYDILISRGGTRPTRMNVNNLRMNAGQTYSLYIYAPDVTLYTTGARSYSNGQLSVSAPTGRCGDAPFDAGSFERTWNGTLYYHYAPDGYHYAPDGSPPTVQIIPSEGRVRINAYQPTPAYMSPAGQVIRHPDTSELILPHDADGNSFDTYIVTDIDVVPGEESDSIWLALYIGADRSTVWVPYEAVTPLTALDIPATALD